MVRNPRHSGREGDLTWDRRNVRMSVGGGRVRVWQRPVVLLAVVLLAHFFMFAYWWRYIGNGLALEDLNLYREWATDALQEGSWQGIDREFIYPVLAMVPIVFAAIPGGPTGDPGSYQLVWFAMTVFLNMVAIAVLTRGGKKREAYVGAYWWLAVTLILNYVAFARIDGLSAPIALMGVVLLTSFPVLAGALLAIATWIKVWPAGIISAALISFKQRWHVSAAGIGVTALIGTAVIVMGGAGHLFSFITGQSERGMQLEAPLTTPGVWQAMFGWSDAQIVYSPELITQEVLGGASGGIGLVLTPLMIAAVLMLAILAALAIRRGADRVSVFLVAAQAMIGALIVFNKVGSPQFMLWLAPVVAVGLTRTFVQWRVTAGGVLLIAILTYFIYPHLYVDILRLELGAVLVLTLRNLLVVAIFAWNAWQLWALRRSAGSAQIHPHRLANV